MERYKYDFSVVMAVYNTADYIREAVESLVHQTHGFHRIQLILVDDGSTDESGTICDEYHGRYPDNVTAVHKENGGPASARNAGLLMAEGRYINFLDSDDRFSAETFSEVFRFFAEHENETDICTVPIEFFDAGKGEHWQNYKFGRGSRVISLDTEYSATLMFVNASFYKQELKQKICFDSRLVCGEDMKVNMILLMDKMAFGVVASGRYYYRRRPQGSDHSLIQGTAGKKGWYDDYFTYLADWALKTYQGEDGSIPAFVQNEIMSDLQWRIRGFNEEAMLKALGHDPEETEKYKKRLREALLQIEDRIILEMRMLSKVQKQAVLRLKHGRAASAPEMADSVIKWDHLTLEPSGGAGTVEGMLRLNYIDEMPPELYLQVNGENIRCELQDEKTDGEWLGLRFYQSVCFRAFFHLDDHGVMMKPAVLTAGVLLHPGKNEFGQFFPVSDIYENAAYHLQGREISFRNPEIVIDPDPGWKKRTVRELKLMLEIWNRNDTGGRKAVIGRIGYHLVKAFKRRTLWVISFRDHEACEGEAALFHYLQDHLPGNSRVVFVKAMSWRHKFLHLLCDVNISSQRDAMTLNPFYGHSEPLRDLLLHQRFVLLQNGLKKEEIPGWVSEFLLTAL